MISNLPTRVTSALLFLLLSFSGLAQQLEQGLDYFERRSVGSQELTAPTENIDKAIALFTQAYNNKENELLSGTLLVEAYTFKARFVVAEDDKKEVFRIAKEIGEKLVEDFPDSPRARFAYIAALGLWGERVGSLTAATNGLVGKMVKNTEDLIRLDPDYRNGIANRIIGVLNYRTPYIPFILSWPSNKKALKIIGECLAKDPEDRGNNYYYAEALIYNGQSQEAIPFLEKVLVLQPKDGLELEERAFAFWAKQKLHGFGFEVVQSRNAKLKNDSFSR